MQMHAFRAIEQESWSEKEMVRKNEYKSYYLNTPEFLTNLKVKCKLRNYILILRFL